MKISKQFALCGINAKYNITAFMLHYSYTKGELYRKVRKGIIIYTQAQATNQLAGYLNQCDGIRTPTKHRGRHADSAIIQPKQKMVHVAWHRRVLFYIAISSLASLERNEFVLHTLLKNLVRFAEGHR